jgi:hypothetical protein
MAKAQELSSEAFERNSTSNQEGRWHRDRVRDRDGIWFRDWDSNRMWDNNWDRMWYRDSYGSRDGHGVETRNRD